MKWWQFRGDTLRRDGLRIETIASVLLGCFCYTLSSSAETMAERNQVASRMVQEAMGSEIQGANPQRDGLLKSALERDPNLPAARWHSGFVKHRGVWTKYDKLSDAAAKDKKYVAYHIARKKASQTVEGQMELADWCSKRKLGDQQRAHLTRVLELNPNHADARRRLGFRWANGAWLSQQEVLQANEQRKREAASLKEWIPQLISIRAGLLKNSRHQREAAIERLAAIDDPAAIPAFEAVLCRHSEEMATFGIEALARIHGQDASRALARQAVFSTSEKIRREAAEKLRGRDMFGYVPDLLSAMGSPIQSRAQLYATPNGRLAYRHMFLREGKERNDVSVVETRYRETSFSGASAADVAASRRLLNWQFEVDANRKALMLQQNVAQHNAVIEQFNRRVCAVLAVATGENLGTSPKEWWKWWNDRNEVFYTGDKPVKASYRGEEVVYESAYPTDVLPKPLPPPPPPPPRRRYECLVAGTPVWTNLGWVPIEKIQAGDIVLSQNPETGELAYKPVLRATVRAAGPLVRIQADEQAIECSGGHPFWISGHGWVKAREMKSGMPLHAVDGTLKVVSVEPGSLAKTYNLIVADFHTYFATEAMILSHDNTIRQPTDAVVPGFVQR